MVLNGAAWSDPSISGVLPGRLVSASQVIRQDHGGDVHA